MNKSTSKAFRTHGERGENLNCIDSLEAEWQRDWYRIELCLETDDTLTVKGYQKIGVYWKPVSNQFVAMQGKFLINRNTDHREAA